MKDGKYPVIFRIIHNRRKKLIYAPSTLSGKNSMEIAGGLISGTVRRSGEVKELNLSKKSAIARSYDLFMFSFYCRGMLFVEIAFLKKKDRTTHSVFYLRNKMAQPINI